MADLPKPVAQVQRMGSYQGVPAYGCLLTIEAEKRLKVNDPLFSQAEIEAYAAAKVAEERERCAQIVREAWSVHGLCCSDAGALADLIDGLDAAAIRGTEATAHQRAPLYTEATMLARVERARAEERERCARLAVEEAHQYAKGWGDNPVAQPYANNRLLHLGWQIADAIRGTEAASA